MKPDVRPMYNEKALLVEDCPIITDLHIGLEHELEKNGIKIPPDQDFAMIIAGHSHPCVEFRDSFKSTEESSRDKGPYKLQPRGRKKLCKADT